MVKPSKSVIVLFLLTALTSLGVGVLVGSYRIFPFSIPENSTSNIVSSGPLNGSTWDDKQKLDWGNGFRLIDIKSSIDGRLQKAYASASTSQTPQPLVISLHTWSGDYSQPDPLAYELRKLNWNYIHPDFRGPNRSFDACLSELSLRDLDDAIDYALSNYNVAPDLIFVVGVSGGAYATVGHFFKTKHKVRSHLAWVPIVDLEAWYNQSLKKKQGYSNDIINCTSKNGTEDFGEMATRSPFYWKVPNLSGKSLEVYAGVDDGHTGSVPISHSIEIFNKIVKASGRLGDLVTTSEAMGLLSRNVIASSNYLGDRKVFFNRKSTGVQLTIFDGGHEMLVPYVVDRLKILSKKN